MEACSALIVERRRSKIRIAGIDGGAAGQRHVCEGRAAVIPQRAKQWIGVDLIARAIQITAAIIAADIVTV
jgi:hypothetical protein